MGKIQSQMQLTTQSWKVYKQYTLQFCKYERTAEPLRRYVDW